MPVIPKQVKRYRGKERIMLRRLRKLAAMIANHQERYPQPPTPNRRHLDFTVAEEVNLLALAAKALTLLEAKWPILAS